MQLPRKLNRRLLIILHIVAVCCADMADDSSEFQRGQRNTWWSKRNQIEPCQCRDRREPQWLKCREPMDAIGCYVNECVSELIKCMRISCDNVSVCSRPHMQCMKRCFKENKALLVPISQSLF